MSYELERDSSSEIPRVPESWMEKPSRIYEILPDDPTYVGHSSIVRDIHTGEIGIDTSDRLPEVTPGVRFNNPEPITALRVMFTEKIGQGAKYEDGFIVDLRYKFNLEQRDLGFHDDTYKDEDPNRDFKTLPVLGAIILIDDKFAFRSKKATLLYEYAESLIEFVDADRRAREMPVYEDEPEPESTSVEEQEPIVVSEPALPSQPARGPMRRFMRLFYDTNSGQTQ